MTPKERLALQQFGISNIYNMSKLTTTTFFYGFFVLLFCLSSATFIKRGLKSAASRIIFGMTLLSFVLATLDWCASIAICWLHIKGTLVWTDKAITDNMQAQNLTRLTYPLQMLNISALTLLPIISDGIVIWRGWALSARQRWTMIFPCALLLASSATGMAYFAIVVNFSAYIAARTSNATQAANSLLVASVVLSLATNLVTTLLILCRLWALRRLVRRHKKSAVQRVLSILVESGLGYSAMQLIYVVIIFVPADALVLNVVFSTVFASYLVVSAMYPSTIVVLVNSRRSMVETFGCTIELGKNEVDPDQNAAAIAVRPDPRSREGGNETNPALGSQGGRERAE